MFLKRRKLKPFRQTIKQLYKLSISNNAFISVGLLSTTVMSLENRCESIVMVIFPLGSPYTYVRKCK